MNRIEKIGLLNALLFILIFFSVSFFNRFAEDDFLFLKTVEQKGIGLATFAHYQSWNTRWCAIAWLNSWYWLIDCGIPIFVFNWLSLVFMIFCFQSLLSKLDVPSLSMVGDFVPTKVGILANLSLKRILFSILFCICFFFCTFNIADAWFWLNSTTMYLWNIGFLCLAWSKLLKKEKLIITDYIIIGVSGLYIGGASEPFLITLLLSISVFVIHINQFGRKQFVHPKYAIVLLWLSIIVSFLIALHGSGHGARSNVLPHTSLLSTITKSFYYTSKILVWHFPIHVFLLLLFSIPWFYLGYVNKSDLKPIKLFALYTKAIFLMIFLTYLNTLPIVYLMGDYGPSRAWTPISFYICIITAFLFFKTGQQLKIKYFNALRFFELTGIITFCLLVVTGIYYVRTASEYAKAYDDKKSFNKLPESGWLHSAKHGATPTN